MWTPENIQFMEATEKQLEKFRKINEMEEQKWEEECIRFDDCSICPMAIHQFLLSTTKHTCVYGLKEEVFKVKMMDDDCDF